MLKNLSPRFIEELGSPELLDALNMDADKLKRAMATL